METRPEKRKRADGDASNVWSQSQLRAAGIILTKIAARNADIVENPESMIRAMALRDRFLLAVTEGDKPATSAILRSLGRATIDKEILKVTALWHISNDSSLCKYTDAYDSQLHKLCGNSGRHSGTLMKASLDVSAIYVHLCSRRALGQLCSAIGWKLSGVGYYGWIAHQLQSH